MKIRLINTGNGGIKEKKNSGSHLSIVRKECKLLKTFYN